MRAFITPQPLTQLTVNGALKVLMAWMRRLTDYTLCHGFINQLAAHKAAAASD